MHFKGISLKIGVEDDDMDSYMLLWKEFELLQEENKQLQEELEALRGKFYDFLDLLEQGQVDAARDILREEI